ncbi:MAG: N-acetylmuramoyl-L-alanine amidase [Prevotellaceae bacterium]|jgi:N-acetylmuramoyl-L-alanine amidase|nr:N-acetylmuramoyl-L-alanine amidase [Prevotellaceae bacterium]
MKRLFLVFGILIISIFAANAQKFTVVLDPGHGGVDVGCTRNGIHESKIALAIALMVGEMLEKDNINVVYTRKTDIKIQGKDRTDPANKVDGGIFISIHVNAAQNAQTKKDITERHGVELFVITPDFANKDRSINVQNQQASADLRQEFEAIYNNSSRPNPLGVMKNNVITNLSHNLASYLYRAMITDKGSYKQQSLYVNWQQKLPNVLVEVGYITNPAEREFMSTKAGQRALATGIYNGIIRYKTDFDNSREAADYTFTGDTTKNNSQTKVQNQPKTTETPKETPIKVENSDEIMFRWQIFAGSKKLDLNDPAFKLLKNCSYYEENGIYKYTYGESADYEEIKALRGVVISGFPQAFIVAIKDGKRIAIVKNADEAQKIIEQYSK